MKERPVVVVGAGPTGALLGIELVKRGADIRIIEKAAAPPREFRAGGIHSRTLEIFARLGLADELLSEGNRVKAMNFYAGGRRIMRADFRRLDGPFPYMVYVPQYVTQRVLDGCLARLGVPIERSTELTALRQDGGGVSLEMSGPGASTGELSASYVVGCDGAHSTVRHQLGMSFHGEAYGLNLLGADVEVDWEYPDSETHLFTHPYLLACLPFGRGRWRLFTTMPPGWDPDSGTPDLDGLRALAARGGPPGMRIDNPTWMGVFHISRRSADRYRQGRTFLAGDAVHIHSPAGGQGMNTGLGDAANLGWKLGLVATGRAPEGLLDTYEPERAPVAQQVISLTHRITRLTDPAGMAGGIRSLVLPLASRIPPVQKQIARRLSQHAVSHREGPLGGSARRAGFRTVAAGDRAPQVTGLGRNGTPTTLFNLIARPEHTVFIFEGESGGPSAEDTLTRYGDALAVFRVRKGSAGGPAGQEVIDFAGAIAGRYGVRPGEVCAIRPDGYIGYIGDAGNLGAYLGKCLLPAAGGGLVVGRAPSGKPVDDADGATANRAVPDRETAISAGMFRCPISRFTKHPSL